MKTKKPFELGICLILQLFFYSSAYDNLSLGRQAMQSSNFRSDLWLADRAVDGDRSALVNGNTDSCAVSGFQREVTWAVDLGDIKSIAYIRIYYRTDGVIYESYHRGRFAGFTLYVSNTTNRIDKNICFHEIQNGTNSPPPVFNTTCVRHGRYVIYFNERRPEITYPNYYRTDNAILELCEVEVYGCQATGVYGESCTLPCPQNCQERRCNILSGECLGCVDGFLGMDCETQCPDFSYGQECKFTCGNCRDNQPCDHVTGKCLNGCQPGWQGDTCNMTCNNGFYGPDCTQTCSPNCLTMNSCDFVNGACNGGCSAGWKPALCVEVCDNNMYGVNCSLPCGNCDENAQCDTMNGTCPNGCTSGFMGIKCEDACPVFTYGINCKYSCRACSDSKPCDPVTGTCANGYAEDQRKESCANTEAQSGSVNLTTIGLVATVIVLVIVCAVFIVFTVRLSKERTFLLQQQQYVTFRPSARDDHSYDVMNKPTLKEENRKSSVRLDTDKVEAGYYNSPQAEYETVK